MGKKKPKIKIDYSKCTQPEDCRICLQVCPPGVFNLIFTDKDYHQPKDWKIIAVFPVLCMNSPKCTLCIDNCPKQAISIKLKN